MDLEVGRDGNLYYIEWPGQSVFKVDVAPFGTFWLGPTGFHATRARLFTGSLPMFGPVALISVEDAAVLPPGNYYWFADVDPDSNGVVNGTFVDVVQTTVSP